MGITGLAKLIADIAPNAIKENEIKNHFGEFDRSGPFFVILKKTHFPIVCYS